MKLTPNEKDDLCNGCGYSKENRVDKIKERIRATEYDSDNEHAIKRKTLKAIVDYLVYGKPLHESDVAEFLKYCEDIEKIKQEVDTGENTAV